MDSLPDHNQLPDKDGKFADSFFDHPQRMLLTLPLDLMLKKRQPDGRYCIAGNSGIYWKITDPPLKGCVAPDWFYIPDVPQTLNGQMRRSYVMWQELKSPLIVLEFAYDGAVEEVDRTPETGKFWIYENRVRAAFYGIYQVEQGRLDMFRHEIDHYESIVPNERSHYPIESLGLELGFWSGTYLGMKLQWLRWYHPDGKLLLTGDEWVEWSRNNRAKALVDRLKEFGVDPDSVE